MTLKRHSGFLVSISRVYPLGSRHRASRRLPHQPSNRSCFRNM
jgi:hypothetical protein